MCASREEVSNTDLAECAVLMGIVSNAYYTKLTYLTTLGVLAEVAAKFCEGSKCLTK